MKKLEKFNVDEFVKTVNKYGIAQTTAIFTKEDLGTKPFRVKGRIVHVRQDLINLDFSEILNEHKGREYPLYQLDEKKILRLIEEEQAHKINEKINSYGRHVNFVSVNKTGTIVSKNKGFFLLGSSFYMQRDDIICTGNKLREVSRTDFYDKYNFKKLKIIGEIVSR